MVTVDSLERKKLKVAVDIRFMMFKDMESVVSIEANAFTGECWGMEDFDYELCSANCTGIVATIADKPVGFMVFKATQKGYDIKDLAVRKKHQGNGIGTQLVVSLMRKLRACGRYFIVTNTLECNQGSRKFLEKMGFSQAAKVKDGLMLYRFRLPPLEAPEEQKKFLVHGGAL